MPVMIYPHVQTALPPTLSRLAIAHASRIAWTTEELNTKMLSLADAPTARKLVENALEDLTPSAPNVKSERPSCQPIAYVSLTVGLGSGEILTVGRRPVMIVLAIVTRVQVIRLVIPVRLAGGLKVGCVWMTVRLGNGEILILMFRLAFLVSRIVTLVATIPPVMLVETPTT